MAENATKSLIIGYSLDEKGLILYKNRLYVANIPKIKFLILNEIRDDFKEPYLFKSV